MSFKGEDNISQSNADNNIYLFALIGGFIKWILFSKRRGEKLYETVCEKNKYKNSIIFLVFAATLTLTIYLLTLYLF